MNLIRHKRDLVPDLSETARTARSSKTSKHVEIRRTAEDHKGGFRSKCDIQNHVPAFLGSMKAGARFQRFHLGTLPAMFC
jgi:hypothetical protein